MTNAIDQVNAVADCAAKRFHRPTILVDSMTSIEGSILRGMQVKEHLKTPPSMNKWVTLMREMPEDLEVLAFLNNAADEDIRPLAPYVREGTVVIGTASRVKELVEILEAKVRPCFHSNDFIAVKMKLL